MLKSFLDIPTRLRRLTAGAYRPEIDGLRFFAIAIVFVAHWLERVARFGGGATNGAEQLVVDWTRPATGVLLFFSISGFILASQFIGQRGRAPWPSFLKRYFGRRILRIEPPYVLVLVGAYLIITLTDFKPEGTHHFANNPPDSLTTSLWASLLYAHSLLFGSYPRLFAPGWSLEVEVQFYILAPLFFFAYFAAPARRVRLAIGLLALVIASAVAWPELPSEPVQLRNTIVRYLPYFWVGILLADVQPVAPRAPSWLGWVGAAILVLGLPLLPQSYAEGPRLAVTIPAIALMFLAVFSEGSFRSFCARPWVSLIGGACYSIYLTHLQIFQVATGKLVKLSSGGLFVDALAAAPALILALAVGLAFYALIERTFMIPDWPQRLVDAIRARLPRKSSPETLGSVE